MKKLIFIFLLIFNIKIFAVLPPFYQSKEEIEAIISDPRLAEKLDSSELILEIKKIDEGYLITTNKSKLKVEIIYLPQKTFGPSLFELKFHETEILE